MEASATFKRLRERKRKAGEAFQEPGTFPDEDGTIPAPKCMRRTSRAGTRGGQKNTSRKETSIPGDENINSGGRGKKRKVEEAFHREFPGQEEKIQAPKRAKCLRGRKRKAGEAFHEPGTFADEDGTIPAPKCMRRTSRAGTRRGQKNTSRKETSIPGDENINSGGRGKKRKVEEAFHREFPGQEEKIQAPKRAKCLKGTVNKRGRKKLCVGGCGTPSNSSDKKDRPVHHQAPTNPESEPLAGPSGLQTTPEPDLGKPSKASFQSCYHVGPMLGKGGFGKVFEGTRKSDGKKVAIKVVPKRRCVYFEIPGYPDPLFVEVGLMLLMNKPPRSQHILQFYEWFEDAEQYIMIMEFPQPCVTLTTFMKTRGGRLSEPLARHLFNQVVLAAKQCIDREVFHRDIKASNILVNTEMLQIKLIDFGCGELIDGFNYISTRYRGTRLYRPPESIVEPEYQAGPATVWTLGVTLFSLVNGYHPYQTRSDILHGDLMFEQSLSKECCNLIEGCLKRDPDERLTLEKILEHPWFQEKLNLSSSVESRQVQD